jgi:hypothetical protein
MGKVAFEATKDLLAIMPSKPTVKQFTLELITEKSSFSTPSHNYLLTNETRKTILRQ